ncbi:MAG TPA: AAA family ATPase, partial [Mycobacteriales bacterium]|nr:AAA family ATPase [Mycobacteriales bacterium]
TRAGRQAGRLVGRDAELTILRIALDAARAGRGGVVELVGEPGIGKSRILEELAAHAAGVHLVTASGHVYERLTPYRTVRQLLRRALGIAEDADQTTAGDRLLEVLRADAADLLPWAPLLAIAVHAVVPPTAVVDQLDEEFRKARLESSLVRLLEHVLVGPTLLVVDDAHWVDEASADLVRALLREIEGRPWLVCVVRRDVDGGLVVPRESRPIALRPAALSDEDLTVLIDELTDDRPLAPHEAAAVVRRAGGNPLFLAELVAAMRLDDETSADQLPDSLEAVVMARIDRLPSRERALLRRLSVLGATFDRRLAEAALAEEMPAPDDPTWARLADFVAQDRPGIFQFQHSLIRDVSYESTPYRLRRELHARIGETLEREANGDTASLAGALSLHFSSARRYPAALHYSRLAAEHARGVYASVEAANYYRRAIDAAERLQLDPAELAPLHEAHGDARQRIGEFRRAAQAYRSARLAFADDPIGHARMLLKQGIVRQRMGRFAQARRWFSRAKKALALLSGDEAATLRSQVSVAFASLAKDEGRMKLVVKWSTRCIEEAKIAGDKESMARAYSFLDATFGVLGEWERAAYSDRALELYVELDDLWGQGVVLNNLGTRAYWQGRWDDAIALYERGGAAWEQIGDAVNAAISAVNIGEILSDQGRFAEAEPLMRKSLRVWAAAGDRASVAYAQSNLGRLAARMGRYDEAMGLLNSAQAEFSAAGADGELRDVEARISECLVLRGDAELALAFVDRTGGGPPSGSQQAPMLYRIIGQAHVMLRDLDAAEEALQRSLAAAHARRTDYEVALSQRALAAVAELRGADATALRAESGAILAQLGVVEVAEPALPAAVPAR